jgi:hypothetical protein
VVALSLIFGTGSTEPIPSSPNMTITLDRSVCYGNCPAYSLSVYGNGSVNYGGKSFVAVKRNQVSTVSQEDVQTLLDKANEIGYFGLKDKYTAPLPDLPTTITSITIEGVKKRIVDYAGAPDGLKAFEEMIDQISGSAKWVECPNGMVMMDPNSGCR